MLNKLEYENILEEKERELEELRESAELSTEIKAEAIDEVKKLMGYRWNDEFANFDIPTLRKLAKDLSSQGR